jgi:hypothetical protein
MAVNATTARRTPGQGLRSPLAAHSRGAVGGRVPLTGAPAPQKPGHPHHLDVKLPAGPQRDNVQALLRPGDVGERLCGPGNSRFAGQVPGLVVGVRTIFPRFSRDSMMRWACAACSRGSVRWIAGRSWPPV